MKIDQHLKSFIASCVGMSFFGISFVVMGTVLPDIASDNGLTELSSSTLVSLLPIGLLLGSISFGPLTDVYGFKYLFVLGALSVAVGVFSLGTLSQLIYLRISVFLIGFGGGVLNGVTNSLVATVYDNTHKASKLSILGVFYGAGALLLPSLLNLFSRTLSYTQILVYTGILVSLSIPFFLLMRFPKPGKQVRFSMKNMLKLIKVPSILFFGCILFFQSGIEGLLNNWTTSFLLEVGIERDDALLILSFLIIGITVSRLLLGFILINIQAIHVLWFSYALMLMGLSLILMPPSVYIGIFSFTCIGAGLAGVFPIIIGKLGELFQELTGTVISIVLTFALIGNSLLNYLMGLFAQEYTLSFLPKYLLFCVLVQVVLVYFSRKYIINKIDK